MIFSYVPLYNILFSVQQTCRAWNDLCFHHYLWREVHYSKEFDERLTKKKLLSVLKKVSKGVKHISFEKAFQSEENHFSFNKFLRCILHENVDMGNVASLKIPSIPYKYLEPLVKKCPGLSSIEIGYKYAYCNDGIFFDTLKRLPHLKEFRISKSAEFVPVYFDENFSQQTMFNEFLADMFSSLLDLEVVHIDSANKLYDSTLCVLLSKCKNLRELALYECVCITNAGLESLPDKSGITSLHLISAGINDDGMEHICRSCPDLREVSFTGCRYITDISIVHLCIDCPNLESLTVSDPDTAYHRSNMRDDGLETLFQHYRSLRSLTLCNKPERSDLVRSCTSLTELDICGCKSITDETLRVIAVCCTNLEFVNLSKCFRLRGRGVNLLVTSCKRLTTLNLTKCRFLNDLNFEAFDPKKTSFDR